VGGCVSLMGLPFLLVGAGSVWILVQIGGKSDGPGALLFYIGAFLGFLIGIPMVFGGLSGSGASSENQDPWP
jgi:Sec-independent protein secretion pathway component TatC